MQPEIIVVGLGRLGQTLLQEFRARGQDVLGVDFDPRTVDLEGEDHPVVFGDLDDPELVKQLPLARAEWIVSTPRDTEGHRSLLHALERHGYTGRVAVTTDHPEDESMLRRLGADIVLVPMQLASDPLVELIRTHDRPPASGGRTLS